MCIVHESSKKKKKIILFYPEIKILFHSLSHSVPLSLSVTQSETLILSQNSLKQTLSSSHPLSPSLSQAPSFIAVGPTQPSYAADRLRSTPLIALDPCRTLLCLTGGGGGGCVGRLALVGGWVHWQWWAVVWLNSPWDVVGRLASVGFVGVGGLWCGWCVVVARVGFMVVGVGVAWWVGWVWAWLIFFSLLGWWRRRWLWLCVCGCDECLL